MNQATVASLPNDSASRPHTRPQLLMAAVILSPGKVLVKRKMLEGMRQCWHPPGPCSRGNTGHAEKTGSITLNHLREDRRS